MKDQTDKLILFVDGESYTCRDELIALAERLCAQNEIVVGTEWSSSDAIVELLAELYNRGSLAFDWAQADHG